MTQVLDEIVEESKEMMEKLARKIEDIREINYEMIIKEHRVDLDSFRKDYEEALASVKRGQLFGDAAFRAVINEQEILLQESLDTLEKSTGLLQTARTQIIEIEETGADTLEELRRQRTTIQNAELNLADGNSLMGKFSRMLRRMNRRQLLTGVGLCLIIVVLVVVLSVWAYMKFRPKLEESGN